MNIREIEVGIQFDEDIIPVGRLALRDHKIYFEYDHQFLSLGLEISPFKLPVVRGVKSFEMGPFEGLAGVFNDSLPDGWGRLLFDRLMRSKGILPSDLTPLDRLSYVGESALGALVYRPQDVWSEKKKEINLERLAHEALEVLKGSATDVLGELLALNGSSAGARPKALIGLNKNFDQIVYGVNDLPKGHEPWIVKFPNMQDGPDAGAIEYIYALMAKDAGLRVPDVHLFFSSVGAGYFAIKRFDRDKKNRFHIHTVSGLLHTDFRVPSLDYEDMISLTATLTRDVREVLEMYRLAVFNVLTHNRDDHAKNFSFLMDASGTWKLAPAYDLTFSSGPGGEQSTTVMGEGKRPTLEHLLKLAEVGNISKGVAKEVIEKIKASLTKWPLLAKEYEVSRANIKLIGNNILKT